MPAESKRVEAIFLAALEVSDGKARAALLERECAGDPELRRRVETLLLASQNPDSLLDGPAVAEAFLSDPAATQALETSTGGDPPKSRGSTTLPDSMLSTEGLEFLAPATKPGSIGQLGHYEIREVIGKGGFGTVFKAFDEKLHRIVAIKVLSPELAASGSARQRFIREARTVAAVTHEHVVTIHVVEEDHRPPYIVMQYIDGVTLQQKLDKMGALSLREILRIGMQMAAGLEAAHKQGLVHRDIKPANVLLENGIERVKITDFGLARAVDDASMTQSGTVAGTPMYMSPEQAEGLPIDHRSDLFSLGTVLYAMCTGHPAFRASGTHAVLKRVIDASPRPIREINSDIPEWLCDIIAKLHAKKPEDRFQTAKEVAELLGQRLADVQAGRKIERSGSEADSARIPTPVTSANGVRRRRIAAGILAAVGIVFCACAFLWFNSPGASEPSQGVQWLIASVTLTAVLTAVFLGIASRRWRIGLSAVTLGGALTIAELTYLTDFFPSPSYWIELNVDDPNLTLRVVRVVEGADPEATILAHPISMKWQGKKKIRQSAGRYWFAAIVDERVAYFQLVDVDGPRAVDFPWAAEAAKRRPTDPKTELGWVPLFNGKDLSGWAPVYDKKTFATPPWDIVESVLVLKGGKDQSTGYLRTQRQYREFHLRFDYKHTTFAPQQKQRNSGVLWGVQGLDDPTMEEGQATGGLELALNLLLQPAGTVYWPKGINATLPWTNVAGEETPDKWNRAELVCKAGEVELRINGVSKIIKGYQPFSGHIALLSRQQGLHLRNIEIKELPTREPAWVQLFNGKDLKGWGMTPKDGWKVENDLLINHAPNASLWTHRHDFRDVHCRVEFKAEPGSYGVIAVRKHDKGPILGLHLGTADEKRKSGSILQWTTGPYGGPSPIVAVANADVHKSDTWHVGEIILRGNDMIVKLDGRETARHQVPDHQNVGHVGLNVSGRMSFRKIEIKELPPPGPSGSLTISNRHAEETAAVNVFLIDSKKGAWNLLDGVFLDPGKSWSLKLEPGEYEVKVEGPKGQDPPDVIRTIPPRHESVSLVKSLLELHEIRREKTSPVRGALT